MLKYALSSCTRNHLIISAFAARARPVFSFGFGPSTFENYPKMARPKRKISTMAEPAVPPALASLPSFDHLLPDDSKPRKSTKRARQWTNPDKNPEVLDAPGALRASPDAEEPDERLNVEKIETNDGMLIKNDNEDMPSVAVDRSGSSLSELSNDASTAKKTKKAMKGSEPSARAVKKETPTKKEAKEQFLDPEADGEEVADEEDIQAALARPPAVNSDYLPLPWKGRLGYACLNTYLRFSNPPVFSSRTCRIASILENRHPLKNPDEPPHATKNRPDKDQPADIARGQAFVESLGLANAQDIVKMLRWNERYGIKFLRLSSEMFPFASHPDYGYKLAPFASEALAEAGKVAAELGHRLTTHPGQFTQLGSPRKSVIENALRDLDYHAELLSLLKMPPQQDRDAVMILHLGGVFEGKEETLNRFRQNYRGLSDGVKKRLVLENDDVSWSVHDLLPLCEELNIPMVLDFHHHNIIFDADKIREGTKDIVDLFPRILKTWERKNITPKMHYSEPTPAAITGRQRRKHSPRVATLPPCPPTMDLMIEAKDKEQAVFELMRTFKLPGFGTFNDIIPHVRKDDNKPISRPKKKTRRKKKGADEGEENEEEEFVQAVIPDDEVGMGGPEGRVYWPPGMEEWLRPVKRVVKKKDPDTPSAKATPAKKAKTTADPVEGEEEAGAADAKPSLAKKAVPPRVTKVKNGPNGTLAGVELPSKMRKSAKRKEMPRNDLRNLHWPKSSDAEADEEVDMEEMEVESKQGAANGKMRPVRASRRASAKNVSYTDGD